MALRHKLSLQITDTTNPSIFRVEDTSEYTDTLPVNCPTLQIEIPGYRNPWVMNNTTNGFNYVLNACTLELVSGGCNETSPILPDGVYKISYSVSPNELTKVKYYHLRTTRLINTYHSELCLLDVCPDSITTETKDKLNHLRLLRSFIECAKTFVEDCHDIEKGMNLFKYVQKELYNLSDCNYLKY